MILDDHYRYPSEHTYSSTPGKFSGCARPMAPGLRDVGPREGVMPMGGWPPKGAFILDTHENTDAV